MAEFGLSLGCNCCGCDIFQCDFDLRYILPSIPADTSDWANIWDVVGVSPYGTARLIEISPGSPGEGLIFFQPLRNGLAGPAIADPFAAAGRQRSIPIYNSHPNVAAIQALPLGGSGFFYEIRDPNQPIEDGFYRLNSNGIAGPFSRNNLGVVIEPPWTNYWRQHFTLHDASGEIDLPVDRFPFVLNPGEYLQSKKRMPAKWFGVKTIRAFHQSWASAPNDAETIVRFVNDSQTVVGIRNTLSLVDGVRRHVPLLEINSSASPITIRSRGIFNQTWPGPQENRRGYWWLFRDEAVDVSETFNGTEFAEGFGGLSGVFAKTGSLVPTNERSLGVVNVPIDSQTTRLVVEVANHPQKLGTITAGKILATPLNDRPINSKCNPRHVCPTVYPHSHVKWFVNELTIPGLDVGVPKSYASVECNRVCDLEPFFDSRAQGSYELPTQSSFGIISRDATRSPRNLQLSFGPVAAKAGLYLDAISDSARQVITGGKVKLFIDKPTPTIPKVRVRVWLELSYLSTFFAESELGVPKTWGGVAWRNPFFNPVTAQDRPRIQLQNNISSEYVIDATIPHPNPSEGSFGWSILRGFEFGLINANTRMLMYWEKLLDPWNGPLPSVELLGTDHDFEAMFPESFEQSGRLFLQSRYIKVLTSAQQTLTLNAEELPFITTTATFDEVDLSQVVLRIGPEPT